MQNAHLYKGNNSLPRCETHHKERRDAQAASPGIETPDHAQAPETLPPPVATPLQNPPPRPLMPAKGQQKPS